LGDADNKWAELITAVCTQLQHMIKILKKKLQKLKILMHPSYLAAYAYKRKQYFLRGESHETSSQCNAKKMIFFYSNENLKRIKKGVKMRLNIIFFMQNKNADIFGLVKCFHEIHPKEILL